MSEWNKLLDGELERWLPDIEESIRTGAFNIMIGQSDIEQELSTAESHYADAAQGTEREAMWKQNYLLAMGLEIQLRQAVALEAIVKQLKVGIVVEQA